MMPSAGICNIAKQVKRFENEKRRSTEAPDVSGS